MNDIYEVFAEAYKTESSYNNSAPVKKSNTSSSFSQFNDTEAPSISKKSTKQKVTEKFDNAKTTLFNYNEQAMQAKPMNFVISRLNEKADYTKAFICFGISAFTFLMAVLNLPSIVFAP